MHPALNRIKEATAATPFEGQLWLVGGAVRDEMIGRQTPNDYDVVTELSSGELAKLLYEKDVSTIPPVTYARFGTALVRIEDVDIELATARKESYAPESRKPEVEPATLLEDAKRRDFTVNALFRNLHSGELFDPLGGVKDLEEKVLRTPLDPTTTFRDDPLRMLRAIRFVWTLGFEPASGLYVAITAERERLEIISGERIREELLKMLRLNDADKALEDLRSTGLLEVFAPELEAMKGVTQGSYHHLDVWDHTLLAVRNVGKSDVTLTLATLLHDVGKPATRSIEKGDIRFYAHEKVGAELTREIMQRLRFSSDEIERVTKLVRNHMRLQTTPELSPSAARRLMRDLGDDLDRLLALVQADANALKPGVKAMDVESIRRRIEEVAAATPVQSLTSPLSGSEIMALTGLTESPEIGKLKHRLLEAVLEGRITPGDRRAAVTEVFLDEDWQGLSTYPERVLVCLEVIARKAPRILAISGFAGSGKSRLADDLAKALPEGVVVRVDDFWRLEADVRGSDWPSFERIRLRNEVLERARTGESIRYRPYDWNTGDYGETIEILGFSYLIVEGVGLFHSDLAGLFDLRIWLDAPMDEAHENAKRRDREEYGADHEKLWKEVWAPNDRDFFETHKPKQQADLVVDWFVTV